MNWQYFTIYDPVFESKALAFHLHLYISYIVQMSHTLQAQGKDFERKMNVKSMVYICILAKLPLYTNIFYIYIY